MGGMGPGGQHTGRWVRFKRWAKYEWDTPIGVAGGVIASFAQVANKAWAWALIIGGGALLIAAVIGAIFNRKRIADLEDESRAVRGERDSLKDDLAAVAQVSREVYRSLLTSLGKELDLGSEERISLYLHDAGLPSFQLLSRHSPDPTLVDKKGRNVYPDHYGLIGKAWRNGWAEETDLPDPTVGGHDYVADNLKKYELPPEITRSLTMMPRVLIGLRYPADVVGAKPIGVLIVESLNSAWDITGMREKLEESEMWYTLQEHLRAQRHALPKLSLAEGLGY